MATSKTSSNKKASVRNNVSIDLIRSRAHENYLKRIRFDLPGDSDSDWFRAEKELMS